MTLPPDFPSGGLPKAVKTARSTIQGSLRRYFSAVWGIGGASPRQAGHDSRVLKDDGVCPNQEGKGFKDPGNGRKRVAAGAWHRTEFGGVRKGAAVWGARLGGKRQGPSEPSNHDPEGLVPPVSRKVKDSPNQGPTAKPREAGLRESLRARLRPTAQVCGHRPPAGPAQSAVEDYSLNMAASQRWWRCPAARAHSPVT